MSKNALPADPTLDEIRVALAPIIGRHAGFDGWSEAAVYAAADEMGVDRDVALLAFKGKAIAMIRDVRQERFEVSHTSRTCTRTTGGFYFSFFVLYA